MNLFLVASTLGLALWAYWFWQLIVDRELRWKIFAIRDDLRSSAIARPDLLDNPRFAQLDASLSSCASNLHQTSVWLMLWCYRDLPESSRAHSLHSVEADPDLIRVQSDFNDVLAEHLVARHWFLVLLARVIHPLARLLDQVRATWVQQGVPRYQAESPLHAT